MNTEYINKESLHSQGIEKYEGSFDQDELGVTQIPTETIQSLRNFTDLAIFTFLASCPKGWRLNVAHLSSHFDCNKEKIYNSIDSLMEQGFLSRSQSRANGKFAKYHYRLHLRKIDLPLLEKPYTVKPYAENPDTYKTSNIKNKEYINNKPIVDLQSTSYKDDCLFMQFYKIYPNKQKPHVAWKAFRKLQQTSEFVSMLCEDVNKRMENNWKNRQKDKIPFPSTYLNGREWEGDIVAPSTTLSTYNGKSKYKTMDDIMKGCLSWKR